MTLKPLIYDPEIPDNVIASIPSEDLTVKEFHSLISNISLLKGFVGYSMSYEEVSFYFKEESIVPEHMKHFIEKPDLEVSESAVEDVLVAIKGRKEGQWSK